MNSPRPLTNVQAAAVIRAAIQRLDPHFNFPDGEVAVTPSKVILGVVGGTTVADRMCEILFPKAPSGIYYHFTPFEGFRGILSSKTLRLFNLHKRLSDGEFRLFCEDHGLDGYLAQSQTNPNRFVYQELMDDLFYTSLVNHERKDSKHLWRTFADKHRGVRLKFQVNAGAHADFRKIAYQNNNKLPLFHELQEAFNKFGRKFVISGLSRFPAYYVCSDFKRESEWRLMVKKQPGDNSFQFPIYQWGQGDIKYIEHPIDGTACVPFQLHLVEATAGRLCEIAKVRDQVAASGLSSIVAVNQA